MDVESQEVLTAAGDALAAVEDLIIFTLKDKSIGDRFAEAYRLCEIAQALVKARARRAADFADPDVSAPPGNGGINFVAGNNVYVNNNYNYVNQVAAMQQHVNAMAVNTANPITGIITTGNFTTATAYTVTVTVPAGPYVMAF